MVKLAQVKAFVHKYRFELTIIFVELVVALLVVLMTITLLLMTGQQVWAQVWAQVGAAEHPKPRRQIKLVTFPTPQSDHSPVQPAEIVVSVTEFQTTTMSADPGQQIMKTPSSDGPALPPPVADRPLLNWPVPGAVTQAFGCSTYYTGVVGTGCPPTNPGSTMGWISKRPWECPSSRRRCICLLKLTS
jgi:hypothetical protein